MAYTAEQRRNIALANRLSAGYSPRVRKALLEAMAVESNFRHIPYGHSTSMGVLQQRPDMGWGPYKPGAAGAAEDIRDFLARAPRAAKSTPGTAGQLAQAIQRSAFPGRYDERAAEVSKLLGGAAGAPQPSPAGRPGYVSPALAALPAIPGLPQRQDAGIPPRQQFAMALIEASQRGQRDLSPTIDLLHSLREAQEAQVPGPRTYPQSPGAEETPRPAGAPGPGSRKLTPAQQMLSIISEAERRGLRVGENPFRDPVDPVHTTGSHHYQRFPGRYKGRQLGRGADISGDPRQQAALFDWIAKRYPGIEELIYDPKGSIFSGRRSRKAYGGHATHVHVGL
jgi:hypothetical protein